MSSLTVLSSLKDQSRERADSSGGRKKVGESAAAHRGPTEAGGERAADSGATEAWGGRESEGTGEEKKTGERQSSCKVINRDSFAKTLLCCYCHHITNVLRQDVILVLHREEIFLVLIHLFATSLSNLFGSVVLCWCESCQSNSGADLKKEGLFLYQVNSVAVCLWYEQWTDRPQDCVRVAWIQKLNYY